MNMQARVITFGHIKEITGSDPIVLYDVKDTEEVVRQMQDRFPALAGQTYLLAVDKAIVSGKTVLTNDATIAFLPPFSGG